MTLGAGRCVSCIAIARCRRRCSWRSTGPLVRLRCLGGSAPCCSYELHLHGKNACRFLSSSWFQKHCGLFIVQRAERRSGPRGVKRTADERGRDSCIRAAEKPPSVRKSQHLSAKSYGTMKNHSLRPIRSTRFPACWTSVQRTVLQNFEGGFFFCSPSWQHDGKLLTLWWTFSDL